MGDGWREHLEVNDAGTVTIKAHGRMKTDAKIVTKNGLVIKRV